jgi:hypothetical protein
MSGAGLGLSITKKMIEIRRRTDLCKQLGKVCFTL